MIDQQIDIATKDGKTTTFITHPERGGPFPVIIFYMDAPAIREELRDMARRLGTSGYYVMLPNMYYRSGVMELGPIPPDPEAPERKQMFGFMNSINIPMVMEDTKALLAYAETQEAANTKIVGTVGYCMSGRYAVNAATHFPDRVKAAASIYGTHLATDQPDSPHLAAAKTKAELYFACAETDIYAPQEIIDKVAAGMKGSNNEVEVYPGTHHGFAFPKRPVYHRDAAERHWERLLALYRRNLVPMIAAPDALPQPSPFRQSIPSPSRSDRSRSDWYALAYIGGIVLGWIYARTLIRSEKLWGGPAPIAPVQLDDFILWVTLGIILGGRTGYVLFYNLAFFIAASGRHSQIVGGRHVVSRRLSRLRRRGDAVCAARTISPSCRSATSRPRSLRSEYSSGGSPTSSKASCGGGGGCQRALANGLSR